MSELTVLDTLPKEFLEISSREIKEVFNTPTLIHLRGDKKPALFISILLHGNEFSGLEVMQEILKKYQTKTGYKLPRDIWLFVGNVDAATLGLRAIDGQVDFNRAWPGTPHTQTKIAKLIKEVIDTISQEPLFASVDIHNNTGQNPHYGCISMVNEKNKHLATLFNHIAMVFKTPKGVSTMAFDKLCPAITLECSTPGNKPAKAKAFELIDNLMHIDHLPEKAIAKQDLQLVQNFATIQINSNIAFDFVEDIYSASMLDLHIKKNFDHHNFTLLEENEVFAYTSVVKPLLVTSSEGKDITDEIIQNHAGALSLKKAFMPAMITTDKKIVAQDCLCYLLEDYEPINHGNT